MHDSVVCDQGQIHLYSSRDNCLIEGVGMIPNTVALDDCGFVKRQRIEHWICKKILETQSPNVLFKRI